MKEHRSVLENANQPITQSNRKTSKGPETVQILTERERSSHLDKLHLNESQLRNRMKIVGFFVDAKEPLR